MATYKQVDFVTESKQRGGKRDNAGAKLKHGEKTAVIRLPVSLVEKIKQGSFETVAESNNDLAAKLQNEIVTNSKLQQEISELKAELAKIKESKPVPIPYSASFADKKMIAELKVKIAELKVKIAEFEANETLLVAAVRKKLLKLSLAELAAINEKLNCFG